MSDEINYQRLNVDNFTGHSLDDFVRHQTVTECWRKIDNGWKLVPNVYEENWSQVQCREIAEDMVHNTNLDQTGFGAFDGERIIGFVTVSHRIFGAAEDMCSWFVFRYQRNTGVRASAGSFFQWLVKRPGGWVLRSCTYQPIPRKSHRRHTGHLAVRLRRRSMRDWHHRSPLMSKWNTDYKRVS